MTDTGSSPRLQVVFPPQCNVQVIGYLEDTNGIKYSRDIGRSFQLGQQIYYIFGDTFCYDREGSYTGIRSNTAALVRDRNLPQQSTYLCVGDDGIVEPLLPLNPEEHYLEAVNKNIRVTLWGFGGLVEISHGVGLIWYQKGIYRQNDQSHEYIGIGLARITIDTTTGSLSSYRYPGLLFKADEPLIGSFSCLLESCYIYLYGKIESRMILARVYKYLAEHRNAYTFFDGSSWVHDWRQASTLFDQIYHGGIIRSNLFGKDRPWVLVGNNKWMDNKIQLGAAKALEGPWEILPVTEAKGIDHAEQGAMYCIYPHDWVLKDSSTSELVVTWSEHWPGGVVAGKLLFDVSEAFGGERSEL